MARKRTAAGTAAPVSTAPGHPSPLLDRAMPINELVQGFAKHIKALKSPGTKEATVRQNYIDSFWRALGWDVGDAQQRGPAQAEVIVEPSMDLPDDDGLRSRQPDYLFRVNGFARFVVEAKKPSVDLDADKRAIFQAKRYAWSAAIPFAILTDFEQFRLYDTTLKPIFHEPRRGLVKKFSLDYGNYGAQWDVLRDTFGRLPSKAARSVKRPAATRTVNQRAGDTSHFVGGFRVRLHRDTLYPYFSEADAPRLVRTLTRPVY